MNQNKSETLLDSSALIALFVENDTFHNTVKETFSKITHSTLLFSVFEEVIAVLHHRVNPTKAREVSAVLLNNQLITIATITNQHTQEINELWQTLPDDIDFVDASLLWAQKKYNLPIITFDTLLNSLQKKPTNSTDSPYLTQ